MPTKFAVFEIFPLNFFNWIVKYSFSKFSLASFNGTDRLFSAIWSSKLSIFNDSLIIFEINIQPLSQRISDIPHLIKYFSKKISENYNIKELEIDENDSYILNHDWKGNVRELRNLIERIAILQPGTNEKISNIIKESLKNDNFKDNISENSLSVPLKEAREKFEKEYLTIQLKKFKGNISKTANFVGMERSALHRKLKGLGIKEFN